jgi:hypothetical protein
MKKKRTHIPLLHELHHFMIYSAAVHELIWLYLKLQQTFRQETMTMHTPTPTAQQENML